MQTHYTYHVYRSNSFLGLLPNVTSEFSYPQEVNSGAVEIQVVVSESADTVDEDTEAILLETGEELQDESGNPILEEQAQSLAGVSTSGNLIANGNAIKVYEISDDNPDGKLVFNGWITSWEAQYGGEDGIIVTCLSKGVDLQDYVIQSGITTQASQTNEDAGKTGGIWGFAFLQNINFGSNTDFDQVVFKINTGGFDTDMIINLYQGDPSSDLYSVIGGEGSYSTSNPKIADSNQVVFNNNGAGEVTFTFPSTITLTAGVNYYFTIWGFRGDFSAMTFEATGTAAASPFARARYAVATTNNTSYSLDLDTANDDMYMKLLLLTGNTTSAYTSDDPTDILKDIVDDYVAQGGQVNYDGSSTDNTGLSVSYTFKVNTTLEGIQKCMELAPYDWRWYVDPGSLILYFKQLSATADHLFVKGAHVNSLSLKLTTDNIVNKLYFTGGDTGAGENLYQVYTNSSSIVTHGRQRLNRISDNRVTLAATADILADSILDQNADEDYETPLTINGANYDISTINVGDTVGFSGFGGLIDNLIIEIVRIVRHPDHIDLTLGRIPPQQSKKTAQALKDILALETVDNPDTPS